MSGPIVKRLKEIEKAATPEAIAKEVFNYFVSVTPIDKGNARNKTKLSGDTIHANYPYATRLDTGWSKQAKDGMSKPTLEKLSQLVKNNLKR